MGFGKENTSKNISAAIDPRTGRSLGKSHGGVDDVMANGLTPQEAQHIRTMKDELARKRLED